MGKENNDTDLNLNNKKEREAKQTKINLSSKRDLLRKIYFSIRVSFQLC
jgi:hypothetical protein